MRCCDKRKTGAANVCDDVANNWAGQTALGFGFILVVSFIADLGTTVSSFTILRHNI